MLRAVLGIVPGERWQRMLAIYDRCADLVADGDHGLAAAKAAAVDGPIAALHAFAAATATPLDDVAIAALDGWIRTGLAWVSVAIEAVADAADRIDRAMVWMRGMVYRVAGWRHTVRRWVDDASRRGPERT